MVDSRHTSQRTPDESALTGSAEPRARNPFFPLVTVTVGLFIITIFSLIATMFGDPQAPASQFFARYGGWMLGIEVVAFMIVGLLGLMVDRRQSLRDWEAYEQRMKLNRPRTAEVAQAVPNSGPQSPTTPPAKTP